MTAFCSQPSCIVKRDWCHPSFAVWQISGKRMMLSSLAISSFVMLPLPLLPELSENIQLCRLWYVKGQHSMFVSEHFLLFYFLPIWTLRYIQTHVHELEFANEEPTKVLDFTLMTLNKLLLFSYWESLHILIRDHRSNGVIKENWGFS